MGIDIPTWGYAVWAVALLLALGAIVRADVRRATRSLERPSCWPLVIALVPSAVSLIANWTYDDLPPTDAVIKADAFSGLSSLLALGLLVVWLWRGRRGGIFSVIALCGAVWLMGFVGAFSLMLKID